MFCIYERIPQLAEKDVKAFLFTSNMRNPITFLITCMFCFVMARYMKETQR